MRKFLLPECLEHYSWKGQKNSTHDGVILNFSTTFPNYIDFIHSIVSEGDIFFVEAETHAAFSKFLRNKNTEKKRNKVLEDASISRRETSSRPKAKKRKANADSESSGSDDDTTSDKVKKNKGEIDEGEDTTSKIAGSEEELVSKGTVNDAE